MICEIVFLFFYQPDYYLQRKAVRNELRALKNELIGQGVKFFQYRGRLTHTKEDILSCFETQLSELEAEKFIVIYSRDEDFKELYKFGRDIVGYKIREATVENYPM